MSGHESFEELCALSVTGDLTVDEFRSLHAHLLECESCRACYRDFHRIAGEGLPAVAEPAARWMAGGLGLKRRFMERIGREGLSIPEKRGSAFVWRAAAPAALAAGIAIGALALRPAPRVERMPVYVADDNRIARLEARIRELETIKPAPPPALAPVEQPHDLTPQLDQMRAELEAARRQAAEAAETRAADLRRAQDGASQFESALKRAESELARWKREAESADGERSADAAVLAQQQLRIGELTSRVREQEETINRERELLAVNKDVRDLMGARNLRIMDVEDDGSSTKRGKAGRIFYTQGKSLIFYAYDLQDKGNVSRVGFQVWGKRDGRAQTAKSLGMMYIDDAAQKRWVLKFEDPAVLAQIDQVFVTVEPKAGSKQPTGRQFLTAAFINDEANHP